MSSIATDSLGKTPLIQKMNDAFTKLESLQLTVENALNAEPNFFVEGGRGVFKEGYSKDYDHLKSLCFNSEKSVSAYEEKLKSETLIASLKIKKHQSFGLLIEVTKTHMSKVPDSFIRRQTMVNAERFVTTELKALEESLEKASHNFIALENQLYLQLLGELSSFKDDVREALNLWAEFDLLFSFSWQAHLYRYCEPEITDSHEIAIEGLRHPVLEKIQGSHNFVPNDVLMNDLKKQLIITGPNMGGKSTYMRQTAICLLLNQIGSFVPAKKAKLTLVDQIFTRIGSGDDLASGQSTFMVEMKETSRILSRATSKSFVMIDEVGRGTSTTDGMALAKAIILYISSQQKSFCMFSTHFHEIIPTLQKEKTFSFIKTQVSEITRKNNKDNLPQIIFTHKMEAGVAASSFGLEVARLAGISEEIIQNARQEIQKEYDISAQSSSKKMGLSKSVSQLFDEKDSKIFPTGLITNTQINSVERKVLDKIKSLNPFRMTPIQALNTLDQLKSDLIEKIEIPTLFDGKMNENEDPKSKI